MFRHTLEIDGRRYVLLEESELGRLEKPYERTRQVREKRQSGRLPLFRKRDKQAYVRALGYVRMSIARDNIRERKALGLTQADLAKLSRVQQETICRLEKGLQSPTVRTVERIDRALQRAARARKTVRARR